MSRQAFIRNEFPWPKACSNGTPIEWMGDEGWVRLSGGRIAVIELTEHACHQIPTMDHWNGFRVRILDSNKGEIDHKLFSWRDFLKLADIQPHKNASGQDHLVVLGYCGWHWHIAVPESTQPIVHAIMTYINFFEPPERPKWKADFFETETEKRRKE